MTTQQGPVAPRVLSNRYTVLGELGRGGMGVVWRAEDRVIGRQVAIKEVRLPGGVPRHEREVFQERVLREARSAGRLNDPAVITVYDVLHDGDSTYIVMELVEAPTLSELIRGSGPMPPDRVVALAGQSLAALETAHAAGIVHRDVKPSNLMVLPNGRVKLADFGIAQATDDPRLTSSGALIGSPGYLAPERVRGDNASPASDLWSLGATLYFAVQGQAPFERASTAATLHAVLTEVPPLTRCSGPLASVIMGLLIANPAARLTAPQVHALLSMPDPAAATMPAMNRPGYGPPPVHNGLPTAPGTAPRRRRTGRWLGAALAVLLIAGALVGGYSWGYHKATPLPVAALAPTMTYGDGGDLPVWDLDSTTCANGALTVGRRFPSSDSVSCDDNPHDIEVFANSDAVSTSYNARYPGVTALGAAAQAWCTLQFNTDIVSGATKSSTLSYAALIPSEQIWRSRTSDDSSKHTRTEYCVLFNRDHTQLTQDEIESNG